MVERESHGKKMIFKQAMFDDERGIVPKLEFDKYIRDFTNQSMVIYRRIFIEGSLEAKLPTIWTVGKAEVQKEKGNWQLARLSLILFSSHLLSPGRSVTLSAWLLCTLQLL